MVTPAAPGVIQLEAIWTQFNQSMENTFHYTVAGAIDVAVLQTIATAYQTWVGAHKFIWNTDCQLIKLQVRDLTTPTSASIIRNVDPPVVGTDVSGPLPNNVTFSIKRLTGSRGRANRGRIYHVGLPADYLTADKQEVVAGSAAALVSAYTALLLQEAADASATEVILHKHLGTSIPVIGYAYADTYVDSQRRRLPGHNIHH